MFTSSSECWSLLQFFIYLWDSWILFMMLYDRFAKDSGKLDRWHCCVISYNYLKRKKKLTWKKESQNPPWPDCKFMRAGSGLPLFTRVSQLLTQCWHTVGAQWMLSEWMTRKWLVTSMERHQPGGRRLVEFHGWSESLKRRRMAWEEHHGIGRMITPLLPAENQGSGAWFYRLGEAE